MSMLIQPDKNMQCKQTDKQKDFYNSRHCNQRVCTQEQLKAASSEQQRESVVHISAMQENSPEVTPIK